MGPSIPEWQGKANSAVKAAGKRDSRIEYWICPNMETAVKQSHQQQDSFRTSVFCGHPSEGIEMARALVLAHALGFHARTHTQTHTQGWTVSPFKQGSRGRKHIMAKQKAPERQLALAYTVTMECVSVGVCLCVCVCVYSCMFMWLSV